MLSTAQVLKIKTAIESLYEDTFNLVEYQKTVGTNHVSSMSEVTVASNIPCRLSFSASEPAIPAEAGNEISQKIELFAPITTTIKAGSKVVVSHNGNTYNFKCAGLPSVYKTHQEVLLEDFKGWA